MRHVEERRVSAQARIMLRLYGAWFTAWQPKLSMPQNVQLDTPRRIFQPLTGSEALEKLVATKRKAWAEQFRRESTATITANAVAMEKDAQALLEEKTKLYNEYQTQLEKRLTDYIRCVAYAHWAERILEQIQTCKQAAQRCLEETGETIPAYVRHNWPTLLSGNSNKRFKLLDTRRRQQGVANAANHNTYEGKVNKILHEGFADRLSETDNELERLLDVLRQLEAETVNHISSLKAYEEPLANRKTQCEHAVWIDYANFVLNIAQRASHQTQILVQADLFPEAKQLEQLELYETKLIESTIEAKRDFRSTYAKIYGDIWQAIEANIWQITTKRLDTLRDFDQRQRSSIVLYEPWLDKTVLSAAQQLKLAAIVPVGQQVPQTIAAALIQCSKWFERLYEDACS